MLAPRAETPFVQGRSAPIPMNRPPVKAPAPLHSEVDAALKECRGAFGAVAVFSAAVNILMLVGPLYMLQIYDRVLSSRSVPTLIALSVFLIGAYGFQAVLDLIRSRVVVRSAALLDRRLDSTVHRAVTRLAVQSRQPAEAHQPVRDLDQIRTFLTSPGPIAIVDLPWMPLFLALCFLIHPWLGTVALGGVVMLLIMTFLTDRASRAPARVVMQGAGVRSAMVETDRRNSESAAAMGMTNVLANRWTKANANYIAAVERSSDVTGSYGSISKAIRLVLQSSMLGFGAYLVIQQELTAGSMIAASIMMGRALAPIEIAIANWKNFVAARQSLKRLSEMLGRMGPTVQRTELPKPSRSLDVEGLAVAPPGAPAVLANLSFRLAAGEVLGLIGPSGSGKSSLARTLLGVWTAARGTVRLDGAALDQWEPEQRGRHIGYVSQAIELFDGTIAENISRMAPAPDPEAVLRAAQAAGAHELILRLPGGYDARIGDAGVALSAGQRQRIALARALYGEPFVVVLDEPASNLDGEGESALTKAIQGAKARGAIVIVIAHRRSALAVCDKVMIVANGGQQAFGPRDEVLRRLMPQLAPAAAAPAANLKVVGQAPGGA